MTVYLHVDISKENPLVGAIVDMNRTGRLLEEDREMQRCSDLTLGPPCMALHLLPSSEDTLS